MATPTECLPCLAGGSGDFGESSECICPVGHGTTHLGVAASTTIDFANFERGCISQRQGCEFYDLNPKFCTGEPLESDDGHVFVPEFYGNCTDLVPGSICAFEGQHGEMKCTIFSSGIKCARQQAPADLDARFSCCGCGGGLGIARSAKFSIPPLTDLQITWTGLAAPGFLAQFFRIGSANPGPGHLSPRRGVPYVSLCGGDGIDFDGLRDFPGLEVDPDFRAHWFQGTWSGIINVAQKGAYNISCLTTHFCRVWVGGLEVVASTPVNASKDLKTTWGAITLVEGPHSLLAEISPFQVSGILPRRGSDRQGEYEWLPIVPEQPVEFRVTWQGPGVSRAILPGYHEVATHECSGKCKKCTTCPAGYRINGTLCTGMGFRDFQSDCVRCTASCPPGYYLNVSSAKCDGTETEDRICVPCKECGNGTFIKPGSECSGQSTADTKICRTCTTQCGPGFYVVNPDDGHSCNGTGFEDAACLACSQCQPGQYRDETWLLCNGTVNQYVDTQIGCLNCTTDCGIGSFFVREECTGQEDSDRPCQQCSDCSVGQYRSSGWMVCAGTSVIDSQSRCTNCSDLSCGTGRFRHVEPHSSGDRENVSWAVCDGTGYWDSQSECKECKTECGLGELIEAPCTGVETSDRACTTCELCSYGKFRSSIYKQCDGLTLHDTQNICEDEPQGWHDKDGVEYNCAWYAEEDRCSKFGSREDLRFDGKVATEACCACGGGLKSCLPCKTCGLGTYIGLPCDGTGYSDLSSCNNCVSSCHPGAYLNSTAAPCDGTGRLIDAASIVRRHVLTTSS
jgi:hypothetical protein